MIKPSEVSFDVLDGDDQVSVIFVYVRHQPNRVEVIRAGKITTLKNDDRRYKPRIEDVKRAITDAKRVSVGLKPRTGSAFERMEARRKQRHAVPKLRVAEE